MLLATVSIHHGNCMISCCFQMLASAKHTFTNKMHYIHMQINTFLNNRSLLIHRLINLYNFHVQHNLYFYKTKSCGNR